MTYGDFAESPLETLSALSQEVILPVLSNPMNRNGWPDVVSKEVTENLHKFIANGKLLCHTFLSDILHSSAKLLTSGSYCWHNTCIYGANNASADILLVLQSL